MMVTLTKELSSPHLHFSEKRFPDEYTEEELPQLIKAAKEKLYPFKQFILRLENLNNFKSTVCIQAHDGGVIRNINRAGINCYFDDVKCTETNLALPPVPK